MILLWMPGVEGGARDALSHVMPLMFNGEADGSAQLRSVVQLILKSKALSGAHAGRIPAVIEGMLEFPYDRLTDGPTVTDRSSERGVAFDGSQREAGCFGLSWRWCVDESAALSLAGTRSTRPTKRCTCCSPPVSTSSRIGTASGSPGAWCRPADGTPPLAKACGRASCTFATTSVPGGTASGGGTRGWNATCAHCSVPLPLPASLGAARH